VIRQQAVVQDVRVGEQDGWWVGSQFDTLVARRIAGQHRDARPRLSTLWQSPDQRLQRSQLIADQGLGRVQVQRARPRCGQDPLQGRQRERQALAAGRRAGQHDVLAMAQRLDRRHLVRVQLRDPPLHQRPRQRWR
jgi:hypothetical protein